MHLDRYLVLKFIYIESHTHSMIFGGHKSTSTSEFSHKIMIIVCTDYFNRLLEKMLLSNQS